MLVMIVDLCFERAGVDGERCALSSASGVTRRSVQCLLKSVPINSIPVCVSVLAIIVAIAVVSVQVVGNAVEEEGPVLILTELAN